MESMSADYLEAFGNSRHLTPNLDRLRRDSVFFRNFYATGTRTVRGLEAITLSVPPTPGRAIVKRLGRESGYASLGRQLRTKGYDCAFLVRRTRLLRQHERVLRGQRLPRHRPDRHYRTR